VAAVAISVLSLGACTSALQGDATYAGAGPTTDSGPTDTGSSDSGSSDSGSSDSGSTDSSSGSVIDPNSDEGAADADSDELFKFDNGVTVTIDSVKPATYKNLIGDEEGRAVLLTVDNKTTSATIQSDDYLYLSSVYCGDGYSDKPYILKSEENLSVPITDEVGPGEKKQFELSVAVKPEDFGKCIVNFGFEANNNSSTITAKFVVTIE
jgi:hypothetical protein